MLGVLQKHVRVQLLARGFHARCRGVFHSFAVQLEVAEELFTLTTVCFVSHAVASPPDHSVEHNGLFVGLRAGAQALRLLKFVISLELGLKSIEVGLGADSGDVVSVDGASELALCVEENAG